MLKNEFDEFAAKLGSTYAAINYISKSAREKSEELDYPILASEAISWVLTGEKPNSKGRKYENADANIHILDDILSGVDDLHIKESVRDTYFESMKAHHLIYCYHTNLNESEKTRVRILSNMIWYNIESEGGHI